VSLVEPILTKQEIAELLAAIKAGKIPADLIESSQPWPMRQNMPASRLDLFTVYERIRTSGELRIPNLDIILDNFSRRLSTSLTNIMLRNFVIERVETTTTIFQQSLADLNNQGAVGVYSTSPLKHGCLFHFDTLMAFTLLEIMLGSSHSNESLAFNRNLTTIELSLLKTIMLDICNEFTNAMRPVADIQVMLSKMENNFRLVNIVDPETEVLVTRFNIRLGNELCGQMQHIIPYPTLEPLRERFKALVTIVQGTNTWTNQLVHEALAMDSLVIARSGHINMTIRKVLNLQPGDIIDLQYNPDQPLTILIEDQPIFQAVAGERNGKKAFHVTGRHSNRVGGIHGNT